MIQLKQLQKSAKVLKEMERLQKDSQMVHQTTQTLANLLKMIGEALQGLATR